MKQFVLSSREFDTIRDAEEKVNGYFSSGELKKGVKLYEVKKMYDMRIKFIKRKI